MKLSEMINRKNKLFMFFLIIILLIFVLFLFSYVAVANPDTCGICHEIKPNVESFHRTAHSSFDCRICHADPGITSRFQIALKFMGDFIPHLTGSYSTPIRIQENIPNDRCFSCHVPWRKITPSGDLTLPHEKHFKELKLECVYCHNRVAHTYKLRNKITTKPPMTLCLQCHNGKKATQECKACHTDKPIPENHKARDWFEKHGELSSKIDCGSCHGWVVNYCNECHQKHRPSTHVGGVKWRSLHRERALLKPKTCLVCHGRDYCLKCHDSGLFEIRLKGKI
jgi:hypothetical protein